MRVLMSAALSRVLQMTDKKNCPNVSVFNELSFRRAAAQVCDALIYPPGTNLLPALPVKQEEIASASGRRRRRGPRRRLSYTVVVLFFLFLLQQTV